MLIILLLLLLAWMSGLAFTGWYMQEPRKDAPQPYKNLGTHLKRVRERSNESLAEVSGAVEIDTEALEKIELGLERPSEDILMLLINHFGMQDQEAVQLWETAGYGGFDTEGSRTAQKPPEVLEKAALVFLAMDIRTVYSDGIVIQGNQSGIVMNFTQGGPQNQQTQVAKIGMSYEQAEQVLQALQHVLLYRQRGPRRLPPSTT